MPDQMSKEDIQNLAKAIVEQKGGFYVDPENHYKQHERLERFLDAWDSASGTFMKLILGAIFLGIFALAAWGLGYTK